MSHHQTLRTPGKLLALFLLLAGVPFVALTGLGWHLVEQDRALEKRRFLERLDSAASLVCVELDRSLSRWEELLSRVAESIPPTFPPDVACVLFDAKGKVRHQSGRLLFFPFLPPQEEPFAGLFAAAEIHEYREENCARAGAIYRELARREDVPLQAAALMRLARCLRRQQRIEDALAVYDKLAALGGIPVAGSPAELLARRERVALLKLIGNSRAASNEATLLDFARMEAGRQSIAWRG